jgi:hypothetical protein
MIRTLLSFPVLVIVVAIAAAYSTYGEIEPCRMLAVDRAQHSALPAGVIEDWTKLEGSQMSTGECVSGLFDAWGGRLSRLL